MLPYMTHLYGNPHSRTHAFGWESEKAVEDAREVNRMSIISLINIVYMCVCSFFLLIRKESRTIDQC